VSSLAPRTLLAAQALDSYGDPQLAPGIHLRVMPNAELGLPVAPLLVYRMRLGHGAENVSLREDIIWRDSHGNTLTEPFEVTPENPVKGYLPPMVGGVCCWIEVLAKPTTGYSQLDAGLQVSATVTTPLGDAPVARVSRPAYQLSASRIERVVVRGRGTVAGVRWLDATTLNPSAADLWRVLALPASSGGRYSGVAQAAQQAAERVKRGAPLREALYEDATALDAGATPTATPAEEMARVSARTPALSGWLDLLINDMADAPQQIQTAPEALLDPHGVESGTFSVHALGATLAAALDPGVGRWLGFLDVDDELGGAPPGEVIAYVIRGFWCGNAKRLAVPGGGVMTHVPPSTAARQGSERSRFACIGFEGLKETRKLPVPLYLGGVSFRSRDGKALRIGEGRAAGVASGVSTLQSNPKGIVVTLPYTVSAVRVTAGTQPAGVVSVIALDEKGEEVAAQSSTSANPATVELSGARIAQLIVEPAESRAKGLALVQVCIPGEPTIAGCGRDSLWDLTTVACATIENPPDHPQPPSLRTPLSGPWVPATPPAAIRQIDTPVAGLLPGALLAFARRDGATIISLNPLDTSGRALPLAAAPTGASTTPGEGELHDSTAPPPSVAYRAAQSDWFGRWSDWAEVTAGPGIRPLPPRPVVSAFYTQATYAHPVPSGTLAGTVRVRVPYPHLDALPPGANLLDHLLVTVDGVSSTAPAPTGTPDDVEVVAAGPALVRCEQHPILVRARWVDSTGQQSVESDPVGLLCLDPRPPEHVTLPNDLQYSSRPDISGKARVRLAWATSGGQSRYRVFYSDETMLQAKLGLVAADSGDPRHSQASAIIASLTEGMSAPDRAAVYRAESAFFTREWWDQLTKNPVLANEPTASYEHELSGALRVLSFFRVVAISQSNVEVDFAESPMAAYAVPNSQPPAKPVLRVNLDREAPPGQARLHVRVPPGSLPAVAYRLRRSSTTSADPLHMAVAVMGTVDAPDNGAAGQEFDVLDTGPTSVSDAPLREWVKYSWRVEAQAGAEPGGGPPGEWSQASDPVTTMLVPADAAAAATEVLATPAGSGAVQLSWKHPDALLGGAIGQYSCEVFRTLPGEHGKLAFSISADAPESEGGRAADRTGSFNWTDAGSVPTGTIYQVVIVDPIGRRSAPSAEAMA
jgi:hypothetical protein